MTEDTMFTIRVDSRILLADLAIALRGCGYTLTADIGGLLIIPKDGRKRRKTRDKTLTGCKVTPVGLVPIFDGEKDQQ